MKLGIILCSAALSMHAITDSLASEDPALDAAIMASLENAETDPALAEAIRASLMENSNADVPAFPATRARAANPLPEPAQPADDRVALRAEQDREYYAGLEADRVNPIRQRLATKEAECDTLMQRIHEIEAAERKISEHMQATQVRLTRAGGENPNLSRKITEYNTQLSSLLEEKKAVMQSIQANKDKCQRISLEIMDAINEVAQMAAAGIR